MFKKDKNSNLKPLIPNTLKEENTNRHQLPKIYYKNGLCYAASRERIVAQKKLLIIKKQHLLQLIEKCQY